MKLCRGEPFQPNDREHFIRTMLLEMRRLLVDHARARAAAKRGANSDGRPARKLSYDALKLAHEGNFDEILNITDLICRLEQQDASKAEFVKLRYFVGLTLKETADALGISISTAQREWNFILAWLQTELAR